ncbi:hypothetical protein Syun_001062 [Stephania yunnanensis]|uniref:Uncharacterized protein n=1 Tax=Stephania yunnanensis TaxID=152371 RepID=A0AAP0Q5X2_9MAGN
MMRIASSTKGQHDLVEITAKLGQIGWFESRVGSLVSRVCLGGGVWVRNIIYEGQFGQFANRKNWKGK